MEKTLETLLISAFSPVFLAVENQSARHKGHAGDNGTGESHFEVKIVADVFRGKSRIERHRMVMRVVNDLLSGGIHALSIKALTPEEGIGIHK